MQKIKKISRYPSEIMEAKDLLIIKQLIY